MRLVQLARRLGIRPGEIIEFLGKQQINIGDGSNVKLTDHHVTLVINHFAPASLADILKEQRKIEQEEIEFVPAVENQTFGEVESSLDTLAEPEPVQEIVQQNTPVSLDIAEQDSIIGEPAKETSDPMPNDAVKSDVIKAPKVELPGLKVIGKIEIPGPKKKEDVEVVPADGARNSNEESAQPAKSISPEKRNRGFNKERSTRPRRNTVALKRAHEAQEAEQKRKAELEKEKERRTFNYLKKVKALEPVKATKIYREETASINKQAVIKKEAPKSLWDKFMRWLRRD